NSTGHLDVPVVHAAQDILVQGSNFDDHTTVIADGDIDVQGLVTMRSADQGFQTRLNLAGHALHVDAGGALNVETGSGGDRFIVGAVNNDGVINVSFPLNVAAAGVTHASNGTWNLSSSVAVSGGGETFALLAGAIATVAGGSMSVTGGAFNMTGGSMTGPG